MVIRSYGSWTSPPTSWQDDLGAADRQLVALAAHLLDQHRQLELAAAAHLEGVAGVGRMDLDRDVAQDLALEAGLDLARRDVLAVAAAEGRGVDAERHRQRRRVDVEARQRTRVARVRQGVADGDLGQAGHRHDLARARLGDLDPLHAVRRLEARDRSRERDHPAGLDLARRVVGLLAHDRDPLADADGPVPDPADGHATDVLVGRQVGHQQLERVPGLEHRRRRDVDEQLEERVEVGAGHRQVAGRRAQLGVRVHDRELDLVLVGAEVHEQLVDVVEDLRRAGVGAVDLVERDDDGQPTGHRLLQHVARLRERALGRVDQQQDAVDHEQAALDLAAEVRVAGRVDDVEADAVDVDRRLLREDRDALLALEVARVHHAVDHGLVRAERAGLAEHRVDEGGLAVVDVGDDRDVAQVVPDGGSGGGGHGGAGRVTHGPAQCRTCGRFGRTVGRRSASPRRWPGRPADVVEATDR